MFLGYRKPEQLVGLEIIFPETLSVVNQIFNDFLVFDYILLHSYNLQLIG